MALAQGVELAVGGCLQAKGLGWPFRSTIIALANRETGPSSLKMGNRLAVRALLPRRCLGDWPLSAVAPKSWEARARYGVLWEMGDLALRPGL